MEKGMQLPASSPNSNYNTNRLATSNFDGNVYHVNVRHHSTHAQYNVSMTYATFTLAWT